MSCDSITSLLVVPRSGMTMLLEFISMVKTTEMTQFL